MCDNLVSIEDKEFIGFKIVAEKDDGPNSGEYFSVAMGIKYESGKSIKPPLQQQKLSGYFRSGILEKDCGGWRSNMVGRTAVFKHKIDALNLTLDMVSDITQGYSIKVVRAKVSDSLMQGQYTDHASVVAGKRITFIEE